MVNKKIALIGTRGIPAKYGGLRHLPEVLSATVTKDTRIPI